MKPNTKAIQAGVAAGRAALDNYSSFDSSMVSDSLLTMVVTEIMVAGFATIPVPPTPVPPAAVAATPPATPALEGKHTP